MNKMVNVGTIL